jgi:A/G-specific adenine glycosylase
VASIAVFTYNAPTVFMETNIRCEFIHHFFNDVEVVTDSDILIIVQQTVDRENPFSWYWALMALCAKFVVRFCASS